MLELIFPGGEVYDETEDLFIKLPKKAIKLEHSLISVSKWEATWRKPFLTNDKKTNAETLDYIKCMTITPNVSDETYALLTHKQLRDINEYIESPMTATTVAESAKGKSKKGETVTSELIYYWMVAFNIPFECQKWHLNRLLMLVRVCQHKNTPPKKRSKREIARNNASLNAARRQKLNTRG